MLSADDCRRILKRPQLTDEEAMELLTLARAWVNRALDEYFKDEFT
jgi:hypothetical protein